MTPVVDMAQTPWEFDRLAELVAGNGSWRILEVGIWEGATLWHWLRIANSVTAIDDTMRAPGPGEWQVWATAMQTDLTLLHGSSLDRKTVEQARDLGPYDFVFIDADHTYPSVKADWDNYRPMVPSGGIVAFHDIVPRPEYGVHQLWQEIKAEPGSRTLEIVENSGRFNGIGVVWIP